MKELMIVANVAIVFGVIYKLFELIVNRKERLSIIEKMSPEQLAKGGRGFSMKFKSFTALHFGCLLVGLGLGLLAGYMIACETQPGYPNDASWPVRDALSIIYGGSVLLGGGIGLLVAFLIEMKCRKTEK